MTGNDLLNPRTASDARTPEDRLQTMELIATAGVSGADTSVLAAFERAVHRRMAGYAAWNDAAD